MGDQPSLFDGDLPNPQALAKDLPTEAHARRTDPGTSHAAARSIDETTLRLSQLAVLATVRIIERGHFAELYADYCRRAETHGLPRQSESGFRTRVSELVDVGYIRDSGVRVKLPTGRNATVWEAVYGVGPTVTLADVRRAS